MAKIIIDNKEYEVAKDRITVEDIFILGGKPKDKLDEYELLRIFNDQKDILYSKAKKPNATLKDEVFIKDGETFEIRVVRFAIIINTVKKEWPYEKISYTDIIELAYGSYEDNPNIAYTVNYFNGIGGAEGSLVQGKEVRIKDEMIFTVSKTDKS